MSTKAILALALAFAIIQAVPASAGPTTCGSSTFQYDSSGATVGPYCHLSCNGATSAAPSDDGRPRAGHHLSVGDCALLDL